VDRHALNGVELRRNQRGRRASSHDVTEQNDGEQQSIGLSACMKWDTRIYWITQAE
jgi:hypothetical protein